MVVTSGELRRELGLFDATAVGLGAIVGAGIFVVTGVAADLAGPAILVSLVLAGLLAAANALSSAQLAASIPASGGTYEYGHRLIGPLAGFVAGWMFLASKIAAAGTVALGLGAYVRIALPGVSPRMIAVAAVFVFTGVNWLGIRKSSHANIAIVSVAVGSLILFAAAGAGSLDMRNFRPFAPDGSAAVLRAAAILFFAYTGYARIATLAEEVRDPRRTIPLAIVITIASAILLYLLVAFVAIGTAGAPALSESPAPLARAAALSKFGWLPSAVTAGAIAAMLGVILSQLLGMSRVVLAMARRHELPGVFAHVDPVRGVPGNAVMGVGAAAALVAATGSLARVAAAASFAILIYYAITNLAALKMPAADRRYPSWIPSVGLAGCLLLSAALPARTILMGLAVLVTGLILRLVFISSRKGKHQP